MTTIKVIFYKAEGNLLDKLVRWWTSSLYSHCEILFNDGRIYSADGWNSKMVRYTTKYNLDNWAVLEVPLTDTKYRHLKNWCSDRVGQKYDWLGVIRFVLPFVPQSDDKWFCSELCGAALKFVGLLGFNVDVHGMSPQGLYNKLLPLHKKALSK